MCAGSYTNYSNVQNVLPPVPLLEGGELVSPHEKVEPGLRILRLQRLQRVYGEGGACALQFALVNHHLRLVRKGQSRHRQTMLRGTQCSRLVPGLPGRNDVQTVEFELLDGCIGQRHVRMMRRVERTAKYANALLVGRSSRFAQTHSRFTRNSLYKRSSCEPASTGRW